MVKILWLFFLYFPMMLKARDLDNAKLFNLYFGGNIGLTNITNAGDFRFFPGGGDLGDTGLKNYNNGSDDYSYSWLIQLDTNIKWIPNYKFERWYTNTTSGEGTQAKSMDNKQNIHYFTYSPIKTQTMFLDIGTVYMESNFNMESQQIIAGMPNGTVSQSERIDSYMAYFNLGFDIKGFIPSFAIGVPTSISNNTSMFSIKMAYNFIKKPLDAQVYIGFDHFKYTLTDNTELYGRSNMSRIYLGTTFGGGF